MVEGYTEQQMSEWKPPNPIFQHPGIIKMECEYGNSQELLRKMSGFLSSRDRTYKLLIKILNIALCYIYVDPNPVYLGGHLQQLPSVSQV